MTKLIDDVIGMADCQVFLEEGIITTTTMLAVLKFQEQHDVKKLSLFVMDKPIMTILKDY